MLGKLNLPWEQILTGLEQSVPAGVVLESIQPRVEDQTLTIKLAARQFSELAAFVHRLEQQTVFTDAAIASESWPDNGSTILRAVVRVNWREKP